MHGSLFGRSKEIASSSLIINIMKRESLGILMFFEHHNQSFASRVGYGRTIGTLDKYRVVKKHLSSFIADRYGNKDLPLDTIRPQFVLDFDAWLRRKRGLAPNSVWGYMITLKHIFALAQNEGLIRINPFAFYVNRYTSVDRGFLTEEELLHLANADGLTRSEELVRDVFIFSAFTGLSYIDIRELQSCHLQKLFDGNYWIIKRRKKTNTESSVQLLDVPLQLIMKWKGASIGTYLFPVPSNNYCNRILKQIALQCGIKRKVTFHVARHTFATMAINRGIPIESLSSILGHTNIRTTQIYAKITRKKISEDMSLLAQELNEVEQCLCRSLQSRESEVCLQVSPSPGFAGSAENRRAIFMG
ncbi:MAG: site-specific integrase [Bacteroidales bacterium]|nr:site-specific integrase [Bacteroidales bacterium]MBQ7710027.1 site-specific integrase [Bacteroidales bacterium]